MMPTAVTFSNTFPSSLPEDHVGAVSRGRYVILQALVGIMLGYQLVFGPEPIVSRGLSEFIVGGLIVLIGCLVAVPASMLQAAWFSGALITVDTALVTGTMYLSGHARSELYLAYFILMLIAASLRKLSHVIAFSLLLCAGYGVVLYQGVVQTGALSVGHLLGVPVLLVMAIFYGMALETIGSERQQKTQLLHNIETLKQTEQTLQASREQLEIRIKGLKDDLSKGWSDSWSRRKKWRPSAGSRAAWPTSSAISFPSSASRPAWSCRISFPKILYMEPSMRFFGRGNRRPGSRRNWRRSILSTSNSVM
jgi:hypothetical protein